MVKSTLIFVHIPRTGGTSIRGAVLRAIGKDQCVEVYGDLINDAHKYIDAIPYDRQLSTRVITGHFSFARHALALPCMYAAVVRSPVDRCVSLYKYILADRSNYLHSIATRMALCELVTSGLASEFHDGQVRQLSGNHGEFMQTPGTPFLDCSADDVGCVIKRLSDPDVIVGTTDALSVFANRIGRVLGAYLMVTRENVSRVKYVPTRKDLDTVAEHNQFDIALYDWVKGKK